MRFFFVEGEATDTMFLGIARSTYDYESTKIAEDDSLPDKIKKTSKQVVMITVQVKIKSNLKRTV